MNISSEVCHTALWHLKGPVPQEVSRWLLTCSMIRTRCPGLSSASLHTCRVATGLTPSEDKLYSPVPDDKWLGSPVLGVPS